MEADALAREADVIFFDGRFDQSHSPIKDALLDGIFDVEPENCNSRTELTYRRAIAIRESVGDFAGHVQEAHGLFALAEWAPILDVDLFSILVVHYNLVIGTLNDIGSGDPELEEVRKRLETLESFSAYMATEVGYGNNLAALRTEARYDRRSRTFLINTPEPAARKFMSTAGPAPFSKSAIVLARLFVDEQDHGVFPFLVDISDESGPRPGVAVEPAGARPGQFTDMATTSFKKVRITKGRLLSEGLAKLTDEGAFQPIIKNPRARFLRAASRLVHGRLCVASAAAGISRASVFIAATYSETRKTNAPGRTETAVADYLVHSREICTALARAVAVTAIVNKTRREFSLQGEDAALDASLCKVFATIEAWKIVTSCRERCGAQGTLSANRIADYLPFIDAMRTAEGDNLVLLSGAASQMLSKPPPARAKPPTLTEVGTSFEEMKAILEARYAELWHELHEAHELARSDNGVFEAWNAVSTRAIGLGRLSAVIAACTEMIEMAGRVEMLREPVRLLGEIFAMSEILEHQGWCVAEGVSPSDPAPGLGRRIDMSCLALRQDVRMVVAGFGLSSDLLRAPIVRT
ncbi:MAG: hypothetical protein KJ947_11100 [Alphaproteobacteria bacterium]|nr:hypothetical protein [Alphaproteobacteria bacterium]MBU1550103.1 hypothetical protein [Alphaproteobacteria bacterium]MBU2337095.1 hypothetical protein [Alphaproteobacteria bacterium]MBU2389426.1 hypothetical protein [Alphaproteobacteria bacterium]